MTSKFYVVERNGIPAVWQSAPERLVRLLKRKKGYTVTAGLPGNTRAEALTKLRLLFPGSRPVRSS